MGDGWKCGSRGFVLQNRDENFDLLGQIKM